MYLSTRFDYETPQPLFDAVNAIFHFNLDVCANAQNTKVPDNYINEAMDALSLSWHKFAPADRDLGVFWMNPPWGKGVDAWTAKAVEARDNGNVVVGLLGARPDAKWFHRDVAKANYILFLEGRVKYWLPCVACNGTAEKRREATELGRTTLKRAGLVIKGVKTFPVCDLCARAVGQRELWTGTASNSPAVGSMLAIWLPARAGFVASDARALGKLGVLMEPWRAPK